MTTGQTCRNHRRSRNSESDQDPKHFRGTICSELVSDGKRLGQVIEPIYNGSPWRGLIPRGGQPFVTSIPESYISTRLMAAYVLLQAVRQACNPVHDVLGQQECQAELYISSRALARRPVVWAKELLDV